MRFTWLKNVTNDHSTALFMETKMDEAFFYCVFTYICSSNCLFHPHTHKYKHKHTTNTGCVMKFATFLEMLLGQKMTFLCDIVLL